MFAKLEQLVLDKLIPRLLALFLHDRYIGRTKLDICFWF